MRAASQRSHSVARALVPAPHTTDRPIVAPLLTAGGRPACPKPARGCCGHVCERCDGVCRNRCVSWGSGWSSNTDRTIKPSCSCGWSISIKLMGYLTVGCIQCGQRIWMKAFVIRPSCEWGAFVNFCKHLAITQAFRKWLRPMLERITPYLCGFKLSSLLTAINRS